jgi:alpha-tubulin suppressor-like RCC1 family protein
MNSIAFRRLGLCCVGLALMVAQVEGQPFVHTQPAGPITANAATLKGMVLPNGLPTVAWFEWSTNGGGIQTTLPVTVGDGTGVVAFSAALQNLPAYAVCRCEALASNAAGVARGPTQVFTLGGKVVPWGSTGAGQLEAPSAADFVAVSAGASNSFALRNNGTVMGWGTNRAGALNIPAGLSNVVQISTRDHGTLALTASGGVVAWGAAVSPPPDLTNAIAVACGSAHGVALSAEGNLRTWGADYFVTNMPVPLSNVVAISAGVAHSLVLTANGQVAVFGRTPSGLANIPSGLGGVIAVACGSYHNLTLLTNGTVVAWGDNSSGQAAVPAGLSNVVAIAGGERHSLAVKADGTVVTWGGNLSGQRNPPDWLASALSPAAGVTHSLVLRSLMPEEMQLQVFTQTAWSVGTNALALRGFVRPGGKPTQAWFEWSTNGGLAQVTAPVGVGDGVNVVPMNQALASIPAHAVCRFQAVASNATGVARGSAQVVVLGGKVVPWGASGTDQINGPTTADFVAISAGASNNFALRSDGTVAGWGTNRLGALNIPPGLSNVVAISTRDSASLALSADGRVLAWGTAPASPSIPGNLVAIAAGSSHALALTTDGRVIAWGGNGYGQANVPPWLDNVVAIAAGGLHSMALTISGKAFAWGSNLSGQTNVPRQLDHVIGIAAGTNHSLALRANGLVVSWGSNTSGQTNVPAGLSNVTAIAAGDAHSLAVKADGSVVGWGSNGSKQLAVPGWLSGVATVAAGKNHSLALRAATDDDFRPQVFTQPSWAVGTNGATLNGAVLPQGLPTTVWLEWGNDASFGQVTSPTNLAGTAALTRVSMPIAGLQPHADYSCRIVASNSAGLTLGMPRRFTTGRKVTAWGTNFTGELFPPVGLTDLVAVSAAATHALAVRANGTVAVWGKHYPNYDAQPPADLTGVVAVAGGLDHSLALKADGTVRAWGLDKYSWSSVTNVPAAVTNITAIAARKDYCLALKADGTVLAWGFPSFYNETKVPAGLSNVVEISAGENHGLALRIDGTVVGWGDYLVPSGLIGVASVGAGAWGDSYAALTNGTVVAWTMPKAPAGLTNVAAVQGGYRDVLALLNDGSLVGWRTPAAVNPAYPAPTGLSNVVAIASGGEFLLALGPNVPPYANSFSTNGPANSDCVVTLAAGDPNGDPVTSRLVSLPSRGALYQFTDAGRGAPITSPGTPVNDSQLRVIFAPPAGEFGMSYDAFTYLANDGEFDSPPGTATVNIVPRPVLGLLSASPNGSVSLGFAGLTNATYRIWASTNLTTWTPLGAATQATPGWFQFTNNSAPLARRFHRVSCP